MSPGQRRPGSSQKRLAQDPLVERLIPDPGAHGPLTMLGGFVGKSGREGYWRLYLTPEFDSYVEFAEDDVVNTEEAGPEQAPFGGSFVWLREGATVTHSQVIVRELQTEFLRGGITAGYMRHTGRAAGTARFAGAARYGPNCPSFRGYCDPASDDICRTEQTFNPHIPMCQSDGFGCGGGSGFCGGTDAGPLCGTGAFVCGATAGCTWGRECGF